MKFIKPIFTLALTAFILSPALVSADEGKSVSYGLKKQGRVHFQDKSTKSEPAAVQDVTDAVHPADIEPAAGGFEPVEAMTDKKSVSQRMRLPRK